MGAGLIHMARPRALHEPCLHAYASRLKYCSTSWHPHNPRLLSLRATCCPESQQGHTQQVLPYWMPLSYSS